MTQFLKNPLVIHVAAEVVVLGGISFYFQKRMLKIESSIKNVIENVEKMHNVLYQHEKHINNIMSGIQHNTEHVEKSNEIHISKEVPKKTNKKKQPVLTKLNKVINESEGEESFSDDDLDEELSNELNELTENNLKRENRKNNNNDK